MNIKETLKSKYSILVTIDVVMMLLLLANLTLIIFDWIFAIGLVSSLFAEYLPDFHSFYDNNIHQNFYAIDLVFVIIFLSEFIFSWVLSIIQRIYSKWFLYPIFHWYDLAGCIPIGSFRFLRVLRIFSILVRLQNLKVIDLTNSYLVRKIRKYYAIIVEEISDRVVVNILEGVQAEISEGGPVMDNILKKVIRPRQELIVDWASGRIRHVVDSEILSKKEEINQYVKKLISESLKKNDELRTLEQVPYLGKRITETIGNAISGTINNIIDQALTDMASYKNKSLISESTNMILNAIEHRDGDTNLDKIFTEIPVEVIEIIKEQVMIKKWKLKEAAERGLSEAEKSGIEFLMTDINPGETIESVDGLNEKVSQ
jgi:hypothetical protein